MEDSVDEAAELVVELGWVGGYLDGEGHFDSRPGHSEIVVDSVNPRSLLLLRKLTGGSVRRQKKRKRGRTYWRWRLCGERSRALCRTLLRADVLVVKAVEARAVAHSMDFPAGTQVGDDMRERALRHRRAEYE